MPRKGAAFDDRVYPRIVLIYSSFFAPGGGRVHGWSSIERRRGACCCARWTARSTCWGGWRVVSTTGARRCWSSTAVGDAGAAHLRAGAGLRGPERSRAVALRSAAGGAERQAGAGGAAGRQEHAEPAGVGRPQQALSQDQLLGRGDRPAAGDLYLESHADAAGTDRARSGCDRHPALRPSAGALLPRLLRQLLLSAAVHLRRRPVAVCAAAAGQPGCGCRFA